MITDGLIGKNYNYIGKNPDMTSELDNSRTACEKKTAKSHNIKRHHLLLNLFERVLPNSFLHTCIIVTISFKKILWQETYMHFIIQWVAVLSQVYVSRY